uniref:Uncharacterized protein n=1 Tax=Anguilla anguilla TaxID=7936 RepID=A0A0E9V5F9_ANGAN
MDVLIFRMAPCEYSQTAVIYQKHPFRTREFQ